MQWSEDGLVLGARGHGESSVILELMTRSHGRHLGLVHGGRSRRLQPALQAGNSVHAVWRARLDEHLGTYTVEAGEMRSARFIRSPIALYGVGAMAALLRLLPERDPHPALYDMAIVLTEHLDDAQIAPILFVRFELALLAELGFGLDLAQCAATGAKEDLVYVSPKSGRAVSADAGAPYKDRLFRLPAFLRDVQPATDITVDDIKAGFDLTEHFLRLHVFEPRGLPAPEERARFVALCLRPAAGTDA
jgi:DNA repair protein RecO (recombination protein O)